MEGYKTMLARLTELLSALENGELSLDQLVELEEVTRKLHERSIILKYNAYKDMVATAQSSETKAEPVAEKEVEPEVKEESTPEPEEEPAFDFAIFDEHEETPGTASFDPVEEEPASQQEEVVEEPTPEPEIIPEPVAEEKPIVEEEPVQSSEPEVEEEKEIEEPIPVVSADVKGSFFDRLNMPDNSLAGRFAAGKLDSLIGAFGLNEKLRFINDLFDGSSEKFSDAIKALDAQNDLNAAKRKVEEYAQNHEWDPEEEVVIDFVNYVNRRYA